MTTCDEDDLQAFVDGEQLPPERLRAVMAYLAARPEEEARMGDYRRLSENLHLFYDDVLDEPLPARLRVERRRGWWGWVKCWLDLPELRLAPLAAGVAVLILAGAGGSWMLGLHSSEPEAKRPRSDSEEYNEPESLLHRLSERLGQVYVPNLQHAGFALRGGSLLASAPPVCLCGGSAGQPTALLIYENPIHLPDGTLSGKAAQQIAFYISLSAAPRDGTIRLGSEGGVLTVHWMEGSFAYELRGALDSAQLFAIAKIILQRQAVTVPPPEQKQDAA
jgi:anti-sigma factor RsiW